MGMSRRSFVGSMGAGVAALGSLGASASNADGQVIYMPADWHAAEFDRLVKSKARVKQLFDVDKLDNGGFLNPMKNSINGLHFGFNIPADQIKIVAALRGNAVVVNFDDSMWEKYKLGDYGKVDDPMTSKPAVRNIFYPKKPGGSTDPESQDSIYQDFSLEALLGRGMQLLNCHNATNFVARGIVKKLSLTVPAAEVAHDLEAHTLPGVISVPAMVAAIAILQVDGHYAYTAG
jgi:hypothetical protein